ncbi:MAG: RNA pyrophosphohydrolase [Pseudomonadota bacterium]
MSSESLYRPCVGIALFNSDGLVFAGERIDTPGAWQMPQGGIDPDEDLKIAAFRELKEEIGTDKADIIRIHHETFRYDLPPNLKTKLWGGKYAGQEQTWIAMRFTGQDSDIVLGADDHPEFSQWKWTNFDELNDLIVPFKKEIYKQIETAFTDITKI